ncbi:hypothetical protein Cgig2_023759 [Carnegiea gigantea]|uniref:Uncharacterized protein n=1 Tax=Carnegiea gigantea TaxID=171969 RepID=A0A9Q1KEX4_9CARY|nr:hypothetical protein Cgig2_023759 [Carnegiea gigantea]
MVLDRIERTEGVFYCRLVEVESLFHLSPIYLMKRLQGGASCFPNLVSSDYQSAPSLPVVRSTDHGNSRRAERNNVNWQLRDYVLNFVAVLVLKIRGPMCWSLQEPNSNLPRRKRSFTYRIQDPLEWDGWELEYAMYNNHPLVKKLSAEAAMEWVSLKEKKCTEAATYRAKANTSLLSYT